TAAPRAPPSRRPCRRCATETDRTGVRRSDRGGFRPLSTGPLEFIHMRKTILLGGLAALSLTVAGGVAVAQQTAQQQPAPRHARGDADGDGRISRAEFVEQRVARLTAADANRDGTVTAEERRAA